MLRNLMFISCFAGLSACSDPLAAFDRLVDVDVPADAQSAPAALPTTDEVAREGFFGTNASAAPTGIAAADNVTVQAAPKQRGLLGLFSKKEPALVTAEDAAVSQALNETVAPVEQAALAPEAISEAITDTPPKRQGLLGLMRPAAQNSAKPANAPRTGPDARDVPVGTKLAFGEVARVCEAKGRDLGKRVEKASAKGFALYDTAPGTIAARTYHITGFSDGCARQITAATVVLSDPSTYEQFRFGPAGAHLPQGATDSAYTRIKRQTCGTGKNKPCGSKIGQLDRSTVFISSYRDMGHTGSWSELLVHDGVVVAAATKSYE